MFFLIPLTPLSTNMLIKRLHAIHSHAVINNKKKRQIYNMYLLDTIPIKYCSSG